MEETKNPPLEIRVHFIHPCLSGGPAESFIQCMAGCTLCSGKMKLNHELGEPLTYILKPPVKKRRKKRDLSGRVMDFDPNETGHFHHSGHRDPTPTHELIPVTA